MEILVIDKFQDRIKGHLGEFSPGKPRVHVHFSPAPSWGNSKSIKTVEVVLKKFYAGEVDDIEVALRNAEFSVVSIDTKNAPQRQITPHKGGRTVKKSTDVTPEVDSMLAELYQQHEISLGDIVDEAVRSKYLTVTSC